MAVTVYKSTDTSAPTLSGTAGDLINLLDKCLVSGYGSQAAAGWSKPYTVGSTQAVFQPGSGVQHFFHVDDNSPNVTAAGKEAQFRGSVTASAFQTGTEFFPTTAQIALGSGLVIRKSATADATARAWIVIADDRTAYIMVQTGDSANVYLCAMLGEVYALAADSYRSLVIGRVTANSSSVANTVEMLQFIQQTIANMAGHYMPRSYNAGGTALQVSKYSSCRGGNTSGNGNIGNCAAGPSGVDPATGAYICSPIEIWEPSAIACRGRLRGLFNPNHPSATFGDGNTFSGSGAYTGRTFLIVKTPGSNGCFAFDITGPWETN